MLILCRDVCKQDFSKLFGRFLSVTTHEQLKYTWGYCVSVHPLQSFSWLRQRSGGLLGDRIGRLNVMVPMTFLSGMLCLSLWLLAPSMSILALFAMLYGFTSGAVVSLLPTSVSQIVPKNKIGARTGAFYSVISIAILTGAPLGAIIIGKAPEGRDDYRGLIAFSVRFSRSKVSALTFAGLDRVDRVACTGGSQTLSRPKPV